MDTVAIDVLEVKIRGKDSRTTEHFNRTGIS